MRIPLVASWYPQPVIIVLGGGLMMSDERPPAICLFHHSKKKIEKGKTLSYTYTYNIIRHYQEWNTIFVTQTI